MNNITGKKGEVLAENYLKEHKYKIVTTNYKNKIGEIDIIATDQDTLVFVEVKLRNNTRFGEPRFAVTSYKQNKIRTVATGYLQVNKLQNHKVRFDVIEILNQNITHIKNAF